MVEFLIDSVEFRQESATFKYLYSILSVVTLGALPVYHVFYPVSGHRFRSSPCDPSNANLVVIGVRQSKLHELEYFTVPVTTYKNNDEVLLSFEIEGRRMCCCSVDGWQCYQVPDVTTRFKRFLSHIPPYSKAMRMQERNLHLQMYGKNRMSIPFPDVSEICIRHAFQPILVFGYFVSALWLYQEYYWWAAIVIFGILVALFSMTQVSIQNLEALMAMVGKSSPVKLLDAFDEEGVPDDVSFTTVFDEDLACGDRFVPQEDMVMPCDALLLSGRVVMDESMLTGESIPVSKTAIHHDPSDTVLAPVFSASMQLLQESDNYFDNLAEKRPGCVLFAGTQVKNVIGSARCVVYRTGFRSAKGQLISSLLHPREDFLNFFEDMIYVVLLMFVIASVLYIYEAYYLATIDYSSIEIFLYYFDALTDAIPIALIICLIFSTAMAIIWLKREQMFVSESARVNMAGIVSVVCFDKTGTLTDEHLQLHSVVPVSSVDAPSGAYVSGRASGISSTSDIVTFGESFEPQYSSFTRLPRVCAEVMACCHDLSFVSGSQVPVGDLLEVELLRATGWLLTLNPAGTAMAAYAPPDKLNLDRLNPSLRHEICRTFEFSPERARSSAIVVRPSGEVVYLIKGSPEAIVSIADEHTVPADLAQRLNQAARRGMRILAFAYRVCPEKKEDLLGLSDIQCEGLGGIIFGGLLCLVSKLKPATKETIVTLSKANLHLNMITGDHIHTAIAVGVDCGIIPPSGGNQVKSQELISSQRATGTLSPSNVPVYHFILDVHSHTDTLVIIDATDDQEIPISLRDLLKYSAASKEYFESDSRGSVLSSTQDEETTRLLSEVERGRPQGRGDSLFDVSSKHPDSLWSKRPAGLIFLAVTGKGLALIRATQPAYILHSVIRYARIFARARPNDKKFIVETFMHEPCYSQVPIDKLTLSDLTETKRPQLVTTHNEEDVVLFCGDGANDMAALRAATVGLSLCDVETSIAAPVTSKVPSPEAVAILLTYGRWSICMAYTLVSFNIYLAIITTFSFEAAMGYGLLMSDSQFFVIGMFELSISLGIIMLGKPTSPLSPELPPKRYFSRSLLVHVIPQFILFPVFQVMQLYALEQSSFYVAYTTDDPLDSAYGYETTVLVNVTLAQLIIAGVVCSMGEPFLENWWENSYFWLFVLILPLGWLFYSTFAGTSSFAEDTLDMDPLPTYFGFITLGIDAAHAVCATLVQIFVQKYLYFPRLRRQLPVVLE